MFVIAGPPGAGKSSVFSLRKFSEHTFNADDRAAQLNGGSYRDIPLHIRKAVNQEFESFVHASIDQRRSFALETTLRSTITFEQAKLATSIGFRVAMIYVALDTVQKHIDRVRQRGELGGHAASEATLRRIHASSLANLPMALDPHRSGVEFLWLYDNSRFNQSPELVLTVRRGRVRQIAAAFPSWAQLALGWDDRTLAASREQARGRDR